MSKMVRGIEGIFDAYSELTGRTPPINSPLNGRIRVEFDKDRPGYGGGGAAHEVLGMFAQKYYFEKLYNNLLQGVNVFDHVFFYEIHRNYWLADLDRSIIYYPKPPHHQVIIPYNSNMTAAVNNTAAYIASSIIEEIDDLDTGDKNRMQFGDDLEEFYYTYVNNPNLYNWENTWLSEFIPWSNGQHSLDNLQAGLLIHLYKKFGLEFYKRFYRELAERPKVRSLDNDYSRVRDNFYVATSLAVGENLDYFFKDTLRWEITDSAIGAVEERLMNPATETPLSSFSYEPFKIENNILPGNGSGSGWFSNWQMVNPNGVMEIRDGSLVYDSLYTEGNHLFFAPSNDEPRIELTRFLDKNVGCEGSSAWLSFLFKADKVANGGVELVPGSSLFNTFGKIWGGNLGIYTSAGQSIDEGETYFLVSKINIASGQDTMFLWVNPTLDAEPSEGEAGVVYTGYDVGVVNKVQLLVQGWGQGEYHVDEIRIGDTWKTVAPTKMLPVIRQSPVSQSLCEGDDLSLSVTAGGDNINYQWYKDELEIVGAIDSFLLLPNVSDTVAGGYSCLVYNNEGIEIQSSKAYVSVITKPTIDILIPDTVTVDGSEIELSANPAGGSFMVNGIAKGLFGPAEEGAGTHTVEYFLDIGHCSFAATNQLLYLTAWQQESETLNMKSVSIRIRHCQKLTSNSRQI
jgi:hypothetical protein